MKKNITSAPAQKKKLNVVHLTDSNNTTSLLESEEWIPVSMTTMTRNPARTDQYDKEERERRMAFEKAHPKMSISRMLSEFRKQEMKSGTYLPLMVVKSFEKF